MTVAQLKTALGFAVAIGKLLAPRTETKLDDKAVALIEQLQTNDLLLAAVVKLLSGDTDPPIVGLGGDDLATLHAIEKNPAAMDLIRYAVSVCEE